MQAVVDPIRSTPSERVAFGQATQTNQVRPAVVHRAQYRGL